MNTSSKSLALTMKDAARLVGVDYRTIKQGIETGTIPTVQLGARRMIPRAELLRVFGIDVNRRSA
ncbi:helix-turn-helix domain-containing protein [Microbacterium sp. NPDC076911]|uniref:helix-turn-helix domain-containing protein n=1 Tax=Microbacterium sp. NPDC076911 TaxID=3154958 RepID=UPI0034221233